VLFFIDVYLVKDLVQQQLRIEKIICFSVLVDFILLYVPYSLKTALLLYFACKSCVSLLLA